MREKGQTEVAKTLETPVFSRGIEILTEKIPIIILAKACLMYRDKPFAIIIYHVIPVKL